MTRAIMEEFVCTMMLPNVPEHSLILLDCWSGQTSVDELANDSDIEFRYIPPGTTGLCQPLDVYFFRLQKTFIRNLSNSMKLSSPNIILAQRDNLLKLLLLTHNQFQAPRFRQACFLIKTR